MFTKNEIIQKILKREIALTRIPKSAEVVDGKYTYNNVNKSRWINANKYYTDLFKLIGVPEKEYSNVTWGFAGLDYRPLEFSTNNDTDGRTVNIFDEIVAVDLTKTKVYGLHPYYEWSDYVFFNEEIKDFKSNIEELSTEKFSDFTEYKKERLKNDYEKIIKDDKERLESIKEILVTWNTPEQLVCCDKVQVLYELTEDSIIKDVDYRELINIFYEAYDEGLYR